MDEEVLLDVLVVIGSLVVVLLVKLFFYGLMVAVWVGLVGDDFIINFIYCEVKNGDLDLVVVGFF